MKITYGVSLGLTTALACASIFVAGGAAVAAASAPSVSDAAATLAAVAPVAIGHDRPATTITIGTASQTLSARSAVAAAPRVAVTSAPDDEGAAQSVAFQLDGATRQISHDDGTIAFATSSSNVARYISETDTGARILTAYQKPQGSYESRTTFDLPAGVVPEQRPNGQWLLKRGTDVIGSLLAPWALDAAGRSLATTYRWDGATLVQDVDVPADATFPVVADPAWSYTWTAVVQVGSPKSVHDDLHSCFNCTFPVEGAPKAFPKPGQKLPLIVRPAVGFPISAPFTCIFGQEQYIGTGNPLYPAGDFAFYFNAAKGHIDGEGSLISFDFDGTPSDVPRDAGETMRFYVNGNIMNSTPGGIPRSAYLTGAKSTWALFLNRYTVNHGGSPHIPKWYWIN